MLLRLKAMAKQTSETHSTVFLNFELHCSSDVSQESISLAFSPPPKTIADVKQRLETELSVPRCFQSLSRPNDGESLLDSQRLTDLYLRSGDSLNVKYYAKAEVEKIRRTIHDVLRPTLAHLSMAPVATAVCEKDGKEKEEEEEEEAEESSVQELLTSCARKLHSVTFDCLLPWGSVHAEANRRYFIQESGLDTVLSIYSKVVKMDWKNRDPALQMVEICCVSTLWNIAETAYARKLVVKKGGFEMMVRSLMHQSSDDDFMKALCGMHNIFDTATGCISNYCELEQCQLPMAQNTQALQRLLTYAIYGSSVNFFTKMLIANLFFRLTHSSPARSYLTPPPIFKQLIEFYDIRGHLTNILNHYILGVTFARLVLLSPGSISTEFLPKLEERLRAFFSKIFIDRVSQQEERLHYNWITVLPFLEPIYTFGVEEIEHEDLLTKKEMVKENLKHHSKFAIGNDHSTLRDRKDFNSTSTDCSLPPHPPPPPPPPPSSLSTVCLMYSLVSLRVELMRLHNRNVLLQQKLTDYVVMLHWGLNDGWYQHCRPVLDLLRRTEMVVPVPKLSSIAKAKLARTNSNYSGQIG